MCDTPQRFGVPVRQTTNQQAEIGIKTADITNTIIPILRENLPGAEGFENEPLMRKHSPKSLYFSVPYDLGRPTR